MLISLETRIKKIQKKISVPETGEYDMNMCGQLEILLGGLNTDTDLLTKKKNIQKLLGFTGNAVDGVFGVNTTTKIEMFLNESLPELPEGASMIVSKKSLDLVVANEISSKSAYNSKYKFPTWPHGNSGITIGIGYDLGYTTKSQFEKDWKNLLDENSFKKLVKVIGLKGQDAKTALTSAIKTVEIPYTNALSVFYITSIPEYAKKTAGIYSGVELLPPDAQGALL